MLEYIHIVMVLFIVSFILSSKTFIQSVHLTGIELNHMKMFFTILCNDVTACPLSPQPHRRGRQWSTVETISSEELWTQVSYRKTTNYK